MELLIVVRLFLLFERFDYVGLSDSRGFHMSQRRPNNRFPRRGILRRVVLTIRRFGNVEFSDSAST